MTTTTTIHETHTRTIRIQAQKLRVHPTAQRNLLPGKVKRIAQQLDLDAIGVLAAVEYRINGELCIWIIDGQHRYRALMDQGLGEWEVAVDIHTDVQDDARASALFIKLNSRVVVHPYDRFRNARDAGFPEAVGVSEIAAAHDLTIDRKAGDGHLICVGALTEIYRLDDGATLEACLATIMQAWGSTCNALEGKIVEGMAIVYRRYSHAIEWPVLIKKLAKYPGGPSSLLGDARGLRNYKHMSISRCVAERILETYNAGRTTGRLDPL